MDTNTMWAALLMTAALPASLTVWYLLVRLRVHGRADDPGEAPSCGFYGAFGLGPCTCGNAANHAPGGKFYQPGRKPGPVADDYGRLARLVNEEPPAKF